MDRDYDAVSNLLTAAATKSVTVTSHIGTGFLAKRWAFINGVRWYIERDPDPNSFDKVIDLKNPA